MPAPDLRLVPAAAPAEDAPAPRPDDAIAAWRDAVTFGWESLAQFTALADARQLRAWWLADLRQLTADSLRSPAFLALMKFNLTLLTRRTSPPSAF